jgi:riboflavin synthase
MFTGIIQELGRIESLRNRRLTVRAPQTSRALKIGDSFAVSGVCLTAVQVVRGKSFSADLAQETLARTSLGRLRPGALVNLELAARADTPLGGHVIQGHVDGVATLISLQPVSIYKNSNRKGHPSASLRTGSGHRKDRSQNNSDRWMKIELPQGLERYVVEKGSIAIEGISLTVATINGRHVTIAIIPHTYEATNLRSLRPGDLLNIEVDVLAKYAEKLASRGSGNRENVEQLQKITLHRLIREGF